MFIFVYFFIESFEQRAAVQMMVGIFDLSLKYIFIVILSSNLDLDLDLKTLKITF